MRRLLWFLINFRIFRFLVPEYLRRWAEHEFDTSRPRWEGGALPQQWRHAGTNDHMIRLAALRLTMETLPKCCEMESLAVQINGRLINDYACPVPRGCSDEQIRDLVFSNSLVRSAVAGRTVKKIVVVPGKLVNILIDEEHGVNPQSGH